MTYEQIANHIRETLLDRVTVGNEGVNIEPAVHELARFVQEVSE